MAEVRKWTRLTVRHSDDFDVDELWESLDAAGVAMTGYGLPGSGLNLFTGKVRADDPNCVTLDLDEDSALAREIIARHGGDVIASEKATEGGSPFVAVVAYLSIAAGAGFGAYVTHGWTRLGFGAIAMLCGAAGLWTGLIAGGLTLLLRAATRRRRD